MSVMNEEEKMAKLELNRFIYGKQLSKDDIVDYLSILFNLIDNQQKEIKSLTDENNFLKEMYRGTTEYKAIKKKVEELGWN